MLRGSSTAPPQVSNREPPDPDFDDTLDWNFLGADVDQHDDQPCQRGAHRTRAREQAKTTKRAARVQLRSESELLQLVKAYVHIRAPDGETKKVLAAIDTQSDCSSTMPL